MEDEVVMDIYVSHRVLLTGGELQVEAEKKVDAEKKVMTG